MAIRDSAFSSALNKCAQLKGIGATDESANQETMSLHCSRNLSALLKSLRSKVKD